MTDLVCAEQAHNMSHYKNRFYMPGRADNMWFSWDQGQIHFIS